MSWQGQHFKDEELPQIADFFRKQYKGIDGYGSMDLFQWKAIDNITQRGIINLVKDSDRIISVTSVTPKSIYVNQLSYLGAEIGDTYTDSNYQRQGIFAMLINKTRQEANENGCELVYGTPNEASLPGYEKKANFARFPDLQVDSLVFPLNVGHFLGKKLHWTLASTLGQLLSLVWFVIWHIRYIFIAFPEKTYTVSEVDSLPEDWDYYWKQCQKNFDFIINRDKEHFNWRFLNNPNRYRILIIENAHHETCGHLVYRVISGETRKNLIIADFLTLPDHSSAILQAIKFVVSRGFEINATSIQTWCAQNGPYHRFFKKIHFIRQMDIPIICHQDAFLEHLKKCQKWHFTISDSDNI